MKTSIGRGTAAALLILLTSVEAPAQEVVISATSSGVQQNVRLEALGSGGFVAVWQSEDAPVTDTDQGSIQGRLLDGAGIPTGAQFEVNASTTGSQVEPALGRSSNGGFVAVWRTMDTETLTARRLDAAGLPIGGEIVVQPTSGLEAHREPAVGVAPDGSFLVAWTCEDGCDLDPESGVLGRFFDSSGSAVGPRFRVNSQTAAEQKAADIAVLDEEFLVVWGTEGSGPPSVRGQRYDDTGQPLGGEILMAEAEIVPSADLRPVVASGNGQFVVAWSEAYYSPATRRLGGRRFDAEGSPLASEWSLERDDAARLSFPALAVAEDGTLSVLHSRITPAHTPSRVTGLATLDASDQLIGLVPQLSAAGRRGEKGEVAIDSGGNLVATWQWTLTPNVVSRSEFSAHFVDGFESGDTSRWILTID